MKISENQLLLLKNYFSDKPVFKAYLFGSYARAEADGFSDVDILVELDYSQQIGLQFVQMKLDLENLLHSKVDLVSTNALSVYIQPVIDKEKQLIYAR